MMESAPGRFHDLPTGLCEDGTGETAALLQRVARGDAQAVLDLHTLWAPALLGIACRMLGERRAADELLRRVFSTIRKKATQYDPHRMPPFVWAFELLRDAAIECLRRDSRLRRGTASHANGRSDHGKVLAADDCRRLRAALDLLDPESRICLEQAALLEFAVRAAGEAPAMTGGSNRSRLRQALETVRNQLSRHEL